MDLLKLFEDFRGIASGTGAGIVTGLFFKFRHDRREERDSEARTASQEAEQQLARDQADVARLQVIINELQEECERKGAALERKDEALSRKDEQLATLTNFANRLREINLRLHRNSNFQAVREHMYREQKRLAKRDLYLLRSALQKLRESSPDAEQYLANALEVLEQDVIVPLDEMTMNIADNTGDNQDQSET